MTAKKYLEQIRRYQRMIRTKEDQIRELRESLLFLRAIDYDRDRVQTSPKDSLPDQVGKLVELENEYKRTVEAYQRKKDEILKMIASLDNPLYEHVLILRYVNGCGLEEIADDLTHDYSYIRHVHGWALLEIQKKLDTQ